MPGFDNLLITIRVKDLRAAFERCEPHTWGPFWRLVQSKLVLMPETPKDTPS